VALAQISYLNYGINYGRKNMPHISRKHNLFGSMNRSKALIFGMHPGRINLSYRLIILGNTWNGQNALFWMDSWKQLPPLQSLDSLRPIQDHIQWLEHLKVVDLWLNVSHHPPWRSWKTLPHDLNTPVDCDLQPWHTMASQRKICISEGPNILRWGHTPSGTFTIKEAYFLQEKFHNQLKEHIWHIIWRSKLWSKVSTFLWLMVHNQILTWDNLRKRGFIGPSICYLCQQQEESMEHILNQCSSSGEIWDQASQIMRKTNRERDNIISTIRNWGTEAYKSPILNRIWQLFPGFIVWQLWKERNMRIFHSQASTPSNIWSKIFENIQETICAQLWTQEDFPIEPHESLILSSWKLNLHNTPLSLNPHHSSISLSPSTWHCPPPGFCKLNFDGASKGNPGPAGFGAVLRDSTGQIKYLLAGHLGHDSNNSTELWGLIRGIQLASDLNMTHLIIEGDSKVIISLATKIINGTDPEKVTPSWRLLGPLNTL
jgi:hypothetical protein